MLKKIFSLILLFTGVTSTAQSWFGWQAGISSSSLRTNVSNRAYTSIGDGQGYSIGLIFKRKVLQWLSLEVTPDVTQKNYVIDRTDMLSGIYCRYHNTYLQLPVTAHIAYGRRLQVSADAGLYGGYWLAGRIKGATPDVFSVSTGNNTGTGQTTETFQLSSYNEKYTFNSQRDHRMEWGWIAGGGLEYTCSKKYVAFAKCAYYQSLTDQQKKYMISQVPRYNATFVFSVGGLCRIK